MSKQLPHVTNWSAHGTVHLKKAVISGLASGRAAPKEIQDDLLNASHIGNEKLEQFLLDRVESASVNFHDPIKKNKFTDLSDYLFQKLIAGQSSCIFCH